MKTIYINILSGLVFIGLIGCQHSSAENKDNVVAANLQQKALRSNLAY